MHLLSSLTPMGGSISTWVFTFLFLFFVKFSPSSSSSSSPNFSSNTILGNSAAEFQNYTAISDFRVLNRRILGACPDPNTHLQINVTSDSPLSDEQNVTVIVSGVFIPSTSDWVAMISPSHADVNSCPYNGIMYQQTGDFSILPLLCHYPVKAQFASKDPDYLKCKKKECKKHGRNGTCEVTTCSASLKFHVINIRTDIEFVFFGGGFLTPCILKRSQPLTFANPKKPLYGHLSSVDSTGGSMRVTWVSGDKEPQKVQYGNGKSLVSKVSTFTQDNMCSSKLLASPAKDFGWHDPGFIHTAVMTGLQPSTSFSYRYGSDLAGWSDKIKFKTPPAGGSAELKFIAYGDMGKAPRDDSVEHYIQPGSLSVATAMEEEVTSGNIDSIFHIGDISYATGFLVEWDFFLHLISPIASRLSYMTAIGNHERDYGDSGSVYVTPDSGGECGVPYETYFQMPTASKDKPWYSIEQGPIHFTVISTEHDWSENSEQYNWMKKDMATVNRSRTPWLIFTGHRPMYSSYVGFGGPDNEFTQAVEPLLLANQVDLVLVGHVHNYERTCAVYDSKCKALPTKDANGTDTYNNAIYSAPIQVVVGMAGFKLDQFPPTTPDKWSLVRISEFGYSRVHATKTDLKFEYVNSSTRKAEDRFRITKDQTK